MGDILLVMATAEHLLPRFFTVQEVVEITGLSEKSVRRRAWDGTLKYTRIGGRVLILASSLDELEANANKPVAKKKKRKKVAA